MLFNEEKIGSLTMYMYSRWQSTGKKRLVPLLCTCTAGASLQGRKDWFPQITTYRNQSKEQNTIYSLPRRLVPSSNTGHVPVELKYGHTRHACDEVTEIPDPYTICSLPRREGLWNRYIGYLPICTSNVWTIDWHMLYICWGNQSLLLGRLLFGRV